MTCFRAWRSMAQREGWGQGLLFVLSILSSFPLWHQGLVILRQNRLKKKKKILICKCLSSVHLQSIVEKGEIFINWKSANNLVLNSSRSSPPSHLVFPQSPFFPLFLLKPCLLPSGPPASLQPCSHSRCRLWPKRQNVKFFSALLFSEPAHFVKSSLFSQGL